VHLFLLGKDYHLGDMLWLTAVLSAYRRQIRPAVLLVGCPDKPISRILEQSPPIDGLFYGEARAIVADVRQRHGRDLLVHDLRPLHMATTMLRDWRFRLPWHYYRDLWLEPRGQWLATFLHLGLLHANRPLLRLTDGDRAAALALTRPYVALAPHVGHRETPILHAAWVRLKGWEDGRWRALAVGLRRAGYEPVTLAAAGEPPIPGTHPLVGLPVRQAAGVIERAEALITVESGLWYAAAGLGTPLMIVPWWLPRSVDWVAPMGIPYRLVSRDQASVSYVLSQIDELIGLQAGVPTRARA
jgi:hypothetical protein